MRTRYFRTDIYGHRHQVTLIEWLFIMTGFIRTSGPKPWYRPIVAGLCFLISALVIVLPIAWMFARLASH